MSDFFLQLAKIFYGNAWTKAGLLLIGGGVLWFNGILQYLVPPIANRFFGLQLPIPENTPSVGFALIAAGIGMFILSRMLPDRSASATKISLPGVKATINRGSYPGGWRSVQLHVKPPVGQEQTFHYGKQGWRIASAQLLSPNDALMARAKGDDYATGEFYPNAPVRKLDGRPEGHIQPFALEFFIKFEGVDRGRKARFRVKLVHTEDKALKRTVEEWAQVPLDADFS